MRSLYLLLLLPLVSSFSSEGIEYRCLEIPNSSYFSAMTTSQLIHIIEVDPLLYEIKPVKALDAGLGRESVVSMSQRHGALAAINGGFFSIGGTFDGKACGALKIHDWYALPFKRRGCIGWSVSDQTPKMDRLWVTITGNCQWGDFSIDGLNRPRKRGEMILFSPCFHQTTLTHLDGEEVIVINGVVEAIIQGGSAKIPENGYVLSIQEHCPYYHAFEVGMNLHLSTQVMPLIGDCDSKTWESFDYIVGGTPLLLHHRVKIRDFSSEQTIPTFLTRRHARTAVGLLPNGHWLFVVVDHQSLFDGMTMNELVDLMEWLGCEDALNLDGGGSSTMVFEGLLKNSPHGDEEEGEGQAMVRRVSDAILVLPRK